MNVYAYIEDYVFSIQCVFLNVTLISQLLEYTKSLCLSFEKDNWKITLSQHGYRVVMALDLLHN